MCSAISDWFTTATLAPKGIIKGPAGEFGELMFYIEHTLKNPLPKLPSSSAAVVKKFRDTGNVLY